jgi:hypothetical protein
MGIYLIWDVGPRAMYMKNSMLKCHKRLPPYYYTIFHDYYRRYCTNIRILVTIISSNLSFSSLSNINPSLKYKDH